MRRAGSIDDSLFLSADRADVPRGITVDLIRLFSWDVDFQRDIRAGDGFETLFEEVSLEDEPARCAAAISCTPALSLSGEILDAFRFEPERGRGRVLRSHRQEPAQVPDAHPGRRRPAVVELRHAQASDPRLQPDAQGRRLRGADAARRSTPPATAAWSTAGRNGGYGNYIRIRHTGEYSTAYAHLSRFAKGIAPGSARPPGPGDRLCRHAPAARPGRICTTRCCATDQQVNPLEIKQPPTSQLAGADLKRFNEEVARIDRLRGELSRGTQVASKA